jgi:CBS domain-containing protein
MHPGVITCQTETTLGQVAVHLHQQHIHALIVVDRDGRPLGVISDFDLLAAEWLSVDPESLAAMREMTAGELMTSPVSSIEADQPAQQAAQRIREGEEHRLLVTDAGQPVGVVSISDLVASLVGAQKLGRESVAEVMSRAMLVCREKTPIPSVARGMTDAGYRSVLVVSGDGQPAGFITGKDLLAYCGQADCAEILARQVARPPLTVDPKASLREAADKMIKHHVHRLVVVDPDQPGTIPLGILSSYDIVAEMAQPGSVWRA